MESGSALSEEFGLLREHLGRLSDHRLRLGLAHPLEGVLSLTALGLRRGCPSLSAIYRFGDRRPPLLTRLGLRRSPSVQTLSRLLGMVSAGEVRPALLEFVIALQAQRGDGIATAALDGKTRRGVGEAGEPLKARCVFSREGLAALDQVVIGAHREELRAAPAWLEPVAARCPGLEMLTGDARYADTALAQAIVDRGKDYTFKQTQKNRPQLHADVSLLFAAATAPPDGEVTGKGHGRLEGRPVWVSGELAGYADFPGRSSVIMVKKQVSPAAPTNCPWPVFSTRCPAVPPWRRRKP